MSKEGEKSNSGTFPKTEVFHFIYYSGFWFFFYFVYHIKLYVSGFTIPCPLKHVSFTISRDRRAEWLTIVSLTITSSVSIHAVYMYTRCTLPLSVTCSRVSGCRVNGIIQCIMFPEWWCSLGIVQLTLICILSYVNVLFFSMSEWSSVQVHWDYFINWEQYRLFLALNKCELHGYRVLWLYGNMSLFV